ncbi:hypothetical protein Syun_017388 [Stephania yunnanensis]|uniref:Uncharacterized protein n=1 Tax=Stephania yunnanensis TaxID=152371 RepID=A0AAP0P5S8_9MAGN
MMNYFDNYDEVPKFDSDGHDFAEDKLVFADDGFVIEVISHSKSSRVLEEVVVDGVVNNYPVKKVMEIKLMFMTTKHFCSLTDDMDDELVIDVFQDSYGGASVDNFDLSIEVSSNVLKIHVPSSDGKFMEIVLRKSWLSFKILLLKATRQRRRLKFEDELFLTVGE